MISPSDFRDLASGRKRGIAAGLMRSALHAASIPYGWAMQIRNRRYDRGSAETHQASVPVVSVGNLTVGGTGKTPMVEWIARWLRASGVRVAILSRGYGAEQGGVNDEALELELALPDVPHLQNPDRVASAAVAVEELASQLLLLDDGFQHRRLARDLDIVLLDASEPFGFEHVLPRGTLREPMAGLRRAAVMVLSRAGMIDVHARDAVRSRALSFNPAAAWCEVQHRPAALVDSQGNQLGLAEVRGRRVAAFCGIGNPAGFRHTLASLGCEIAAFREFPDHHDYTRADIEELARLVREVDAKMVLCTRKDIVKIRLPAIAAKSLWAVGVQLEFLRGENELKAALSPLAELGKAIDVADVDDVTSADGADFNLV